MLWIALAGGVRVEVDGRPVDDGALGGRQARRLLARLAWEGRAVHRDELADGMWLESLPRTWERTLSGVITRLRAGLKEAGVGGDIVTYLDGRYRLIGGGDVHVDVRDAGLDLVAACEAADRGDLERARVLAEDVLEVARAPLLPGEVAGWVDVARALHRALLLDTLDALADVGLRGRSYMLAERAAREAVHYEPLREAGHQRLLRALVAKGDHAAALTAYAACRRLLAEELGVGPSPETEAIYHEALGVEPDVHVDATIADGPRTVGARPLFPSTLGEHATTLVGRESALVWLWSLWRRARPDAPLTAVLQGPPGAGKRSLAAVFAREVYAAGGSVVHRCIGDGHDNAGADEAARGVGSSSLLAVLELPEDVAGVPPVEGAALILAVSTTCPAEATGEAAVLAVPPLDRASVEALAEEGLGRTPSDGELDELCATTGGWPGAVAGALREWAADRARELAREAARANASLTSAHTDLADQIMRSRRRPVVSTRPPAEHAPYKGLLRFEPEDADLFFGREQLVADVLARLSAGRLVTVLGASGNGKSSVVRAGVIAELRRGALPGSDRWPVVLLTPGRHPLATLTACLRSATQSPDSVAMDELLDELDRMSPSVVVVDQFEELFMLGISEHERVAFLDALLRGIPDGRPGHRVVLALRSDIYERCDSVPGLTDVLHGSQVVVPAPTEPELRRIVCSPARAAGVVLEPGLVDEVIADAGAAPGALPLVSTALLGSWTRRTGSMVTIDGYRAAGGVAGAIATLAEGVWADLDAEEQRPARSMLMRLSVGDAGDLNSPVRREELTSTGEAVAERVLDRLVRRRLVTVDDDTVRLAHEALLREWPRLQGWLAEDRAVRDGLHHLRRAVNDWERRGRDLADLYRGTRLAAALELGVGIQLSVAEQSFVDASADQQQSELQSLRRRSRRLRFLSTALVVLLAVAVLAGVVAVARQREAADQARIAIARRLAQEAGSANGLDLRLLLAVEARRLEDSPEARGALLSQLTHAGAVAGFVRGGADNLSAAAVSPDGSSLATGGTDGTVSVWRLPEVEPLGSVALLEGPVAALAFSSDGELAAAGDDGDVARWMPGGTDPARFDAHTQAALAVGFRRDGALVTAGRDGLLRAFSPATGEELWSTSIPLAADAGTFDRHGTRYAQIDGDAEVSVFDVEDGRATWRSSDFGPNDEPTAVALSADGRTLAIGIRSGGVRLLELDTGATAELGRLTSRDDADDPPRGVEELAFTGSDHLLAAAGGAIGRFDIAGDTRGEATQFVGGRVTDLAVDPTGDSAVAVTETGETILLELGRSSLGRPLSNAGRPVTALSVGADGTVAAGGDGQVALLDPATGERRLLAAPGRPVTAVSSAGVRLAIGGREVFRAGGGPHGTYTVIEIESGELLVDEDRPGVAVTAVALSPDGELLAVGEELGPVRLLEARTGRRLHDLGPLPATTAGVAFTPTGDELVAVATDGTIVRWDRRGRPIGEPVELGSPASALAVAQDGQTVAVATSNGAVIVDLATGSIGPPMASPFGPVESVSFGLDGTALATGGSGGVLLWDVASRRPLGDPLPAPGNTAVSFDPTGRNLVTGGDDGEVVVWQADPNRWVELGCDLAGRTLSRDEWRRYLGDRAYDPACR
jgi:WD40 repeat protein/DNA-binding SARP family transcriptional activator